MPLVGSVNILKSKKTAGLGVFSKPGSFLEYTIKV